MPNSKFVTDVCMRALC